LVGAWQKAWRQWQDAAWVLHLIVNVWYLKSGKTIRCVFPSEDRVVSVSGWRSISPINN
jgi:hypothetical protein